MLTILKGSRYPVIIILDEAGTFKIPVWLTTLLNVGIAVSDSSVESLLTLIQRTKSSCDLMNQNNRLLVAQHQYEQVASNIPMGLFRFRYDLDNNYIIDYVSPRIVELTGIARDRLETDIHAFMDIILPEDYDQYLGKARSSFRERKPVDIQVRVLVKGRLPADHAGTFQSSI